MADPGAAELDALDTLLRGGTAADAPRGGEARALAGAAAALTAATSSEAGFDAERLWTRVQAGVAPTRAVPAPARRTPGPTRTAPAWRLPRWAGGAAALAAAVAALAILLPIFLLDSGSADARFLATVSELEDESDAALTDDHLSLAELRRLRARVTELVEAFDRERDALPRLSLRDVDAALATLQRVRLRLESVADTQLRDQALDRLSEVALRRFVAESMLTLRRVRLRAELALGRNGTDRLETSPQAVPVEEPSDGTRDLSGSDAPAEDTATTERTAVDSTSPTRSTDADATGDGATTDGTTDAVRIDAEPTDTSGAGDTTTDGTSTDGSATDTATVDGATRDATATDSPTRSGSLSR